MLKDVYDVVKDYSIVSLFIGALSMIIKPFVSIKQSIKEFTITFIVSMLSGLIIEYWDIPQEVKYGITGTFGLFGVRLYMIIEGVLFRVQKNPDIIVDKIKDKLD